MIGDIDIDEQLLISGENELVFIGRNLDKCLIRQQLNQCLAELDIHNRFSLPNLPF